MGLTLQFCRQQNRARAEEIALRERRAAARAALTPQQTGGSETNLIDSRLQRLKLEGTPRIRRERRQPAPPPSPLPANMDFSDFMLPTSQSENVDFGSLAQQMMANLSGNGLDSLGPVDPAGALSPASPSPVSVSQFSNGPLIEDALLEESEEEEEQGEEGEAAPSTPSRPTSPTSQLIIDLSTPLKRSSLASRRSSKRFSSQTDASSSVSEPPAAEQPPASDDSGSETFQTPGSKSADLLETLAAGNDDDDEDADTTAGDETILAELPPSPSQIL